MYMKNMLGLVKYFLIFNIYKLWICCVIRLTIY